MINRTVKECLALSDDLDKHEEIFLKAAKQLIWSLHATKNDFHQNGGWIRSGIRGDCYYVHCQGKIYPYQTIYLDIRTGKIFQNIIELGGKDSQKTIYFVKKEEKMAVTMPLMRPVPISTKGKPWWKSWWIWLKTTRKWEVMEDWHFYIEYLKLAIFIPKGFIFDGASIPKLLRFLFSPVGILLLPGLLHDYGYRYGYLVAKDMAKYRVNAVLNNYTRKNWDNLFTNVSEQVNGFHILNKFPRLGLWIGAGFTWRAHRKRNLEDPMFIEPSMYSCTINEARETMKSASQLIIESSEEELE